MSNHSFPGLIRNNYGVYLIFREYMAMLKNFYPEARFLTPTPSHQLQASPLLQSKPASPLSQSFQEGATSSKSTKVTNGKRQSRIVWATKETQILLEICGTKYAEIIPRRREKYGNRFLMSLKLPAGGRIYHKSSRRPWNNLKNESPTWSTNIVKSRQE